MAPKRVTPVAVCLAPRGRPKSVGLAFKAEIIPSAPMVSFWASGGANAASGRSDGLFVIAVVVRLIQPACVEV